MDASGFDRISRSFATLGTRRGVTRLLLGVPALAGLLGQRDAGSDVAAEDDDHGSSHRRRRRRTRHKHDRNTVRRHKKHKRHKPDMPGCTPGTACPAVACGRCDGTGACVGCTSAQDCLPNGTCATRCGVDPADCAGCTTCSEAINGTAYCRGALTLNSCNSIRQCNRGQFCRGDGLCAQACTPTS